MTAPSTFVDRLHRVFDGRLRIRWSEKEREFRIEQKVGRAVVAPLAIDSGRDDLICARDGYSYVLAIRSGDRMLCPNCQWQELRVPVRDFVDVQCSYCASKGRQSRTTVGFWPLDDSLIDHLRRIDPTRGQVKQEAIDLDRRNTLREAAAERHAFNQGEAAALQDYNNLVGIPQFGYSHAKCWPSELGPARVSE